MRHGLPLAQLGLRWPVIPRLRPVPMRPLPAWDAAVARFASVELDTRAPSRKDYDLLLRYATARRDGMHAVAAYLATNDPAQERKISEQREIAVDALKQYQAQQK